jgi:hypothetical protein
LVGSVAFANEAATGDVDPGFCPLNENCNFCVGETELLLLVAVDAIVSD